MALIAATVIAILMEELWIVLAVAVVVVMVGVAFAAFVNGDWWWN